MAQEKSFSNTDEQYNKRTYRTVSSSLTNTRYRAKDQTFSITPENFSIKFFMFLPKNESLARNTFDLGY